MIRFGKKRRCLLLAIFMVLPLLGQEKAAGSEETGRPVEFRWAFGAMVGPPGDRRLVAITRDTVLKTGDQIKILLQLQTECSVYLFYRTRGHIHLLFPYDLDALETDHRLGKKYYIPRGRAWFELGENVGTETFYLLASADRLSRLEDLYGKYQSAAGREKEEAAARILDEIRRVRGRHRTLASAAERPIQIGGSLRGRTEAGSTAFPDIEPIASEVSASGFYSKTFTIEHQ